MHCLGVGSFIVFFDGCSESTKQGDAQGFHQLERHLGGVVCNTGTCALLKGLDLQIVDVEVQGKKLISIIPGDAATLNQEIAGVE